MPDLKDSDGNTVISKKTKEALVWRKTFSKLPTNFIKPLVVSSRSAYIKIIKKLVA